MSGPAERRVTLVRTGELRRKSLMSRVLGSLKKDRMDGLMRMQKGQGILLALFGNSEYLSMSAISKRRETTKIVKLAEFDQVKRFYLSSEGTERREGYWFLEVDDPKKGFVTYKFLSASEFEATGWLQTLRLMRHLPDDPVVPVVCVLGETGAGKSMFCSRLSGLHRENDTFLVSDSVESVTLETQMNYTKWLGDPELGDVVVVDTPGLSDTRNHADHGGLQSGVQDSKNIDVMLQRLDELRYVHTFCVVFSAEKDRFDDGLVQMLRTFERHFGPVFWKHCMIMFSKWYMDERTQRRRRKTKEMLAHEWNEALKVRFPNILLMPQVRKDIRCYFADNDSSLKGDEYKHAEEELLAFALSAKQNQLFDCRSNIPDPDYRYDDIPVPAEDKHDLWEKLRLVQLGEKVQTLAENGVTTMEQLCRISNTVLRSAFGWSPAEVRRLEQMKAPIEPNSPWPLVVRELDEMGLPAEKVAEARVNMQDLLRLEYAQLSDRFGFDWGEHFKKYQEWREQVMESQVVTDKILWVGAIVVRNTVAWKYEDDRRPQDFYGPGYVVNWRTVDGLRKGIKRRPDNWNGHKRAFKTPKAGFVRVYWLNTGYSNTYCIDPDRGCDLKFALSKEYGIAVIHPDDPTQCVRDPPASGSANGTGHRDMLPRVELRDLHCTFAYPKGLKLPHWSKFDVRDEICQRMANAGFRHGDVVKRIHDDEGFEALCVGVGVSDNGQPNLYFRPLNISTPGCGTFVNFSNNLTVIRREDVDEYEHDSFECHSDDGIENDELAELERDGVLQETFKFPIGRRYPTNAAFDIRDEIIARFGFPDLHHGTVLLNKLNKKEFTVVGVSRHSGGQAKIWLKDKSNPGATVWPFLFKNFDNFEVRPGLAPLEETVVHEGFVQPTEAQALAKKDSLELTFEFPRGAGAHNTMQSFDVRPDIVRFFCNFESGDVLMGPSQRELTVIGVAPQPDTGIPQVWFHLRGHHGAGIVPEFQAGLAKKTFVPTPNKKDLTQLKQELSGVDPRTLEPIVETFEIIGGVIDDDARAETTINDVPTDEDAFFEYLKSLDG
ncbi:AIG1 family protein [Durusdinium trenchii]|uniref:AIG1 family protein n=1 Tax=Durusdinium trenchii TaxID=1381693 RepID=A0ABP0KSG2_9DINO